MEVDGNPIHIVKHVFDVALKHGTDSCTSGGFTGKTVRKSKSALDPASNSTYPKTIERSSGPPRNGRDRTLHVNRYTKGALTKNKYTKVLDGPDTLTRTHENVEREGIRMVTTPTYGGVPAGGMSVLHDESPKTSADKPVAKATSTDHRSPFENVHFVLHSDRPDAPEHTSCSRGEPKTDKDRTPARGDSVGGNTV